MIHDFEEVKHQLKELSDVINAFTSEAVQLRIIDLVFNALPEDRPNNNAAQEQEHIPPNLRKRKRIKSKIRKLPTDRTANGQGPISTLSQLLDGAFFDKPQSVKSIVEHCETNLARKIKQSDISGRLAKMVREGTLKREKNSEGQYEYSKP